MIEKALIVIGILVGGTFLLLFLALLFLYLPVTAYAEAKCLEHGYPTASVTWNLKRYCMNLEGTVTVKVDEL